MKHKVVSHYINKDSNTGKNTTSKKYIYYSMKERRNKNGKEGNEPKGKN